MMVSALEHWRWNRGQRTSLGMAMNMNSLPGQMCR